MTDQELIQASLEKVAARHGDPIAVVYARLFSQQPEMEPLFLPGRDQAKGSMLANVLELIGDSVGADTYGRNLLRAEVINHEGLGVPPAVFVTFLDVVRQTFAELLGGDWTAEIDDAWSRAIASLKAAVVLPESALIG